MAQKLYVEVVGDASSLQRAFKQSSVGAKQFERSLGKSLRGAAAGSGAFKHLGRSLAFASGGFIGFATAADLVKSSLDAATEAASTQRQLAQQFRASGKNLGQYRDEIEKTTNRLSYLAGFQNDELLRSFTQSFRATKNVATSLKIEAIAADVARGRHISLEQSTLALNRAYGGQIGSLRRLGIIIPLTTKGMDALNFVQARFAGQARAGTTAQQRFAATFHDMQEIVGGALLPAFTRITNAASRWLASGRNQARVQRDVNQALRTGGEVVGGISDGFQMLKTVTSPLVDALGGARNAARALVAALAVTRLLKIAGALRQVAAAAGLVAAAEGGAAAGARRGPLALPRGGIGAIGGALFGAIQNQQQGNPFGKPDGVYKIGGKWYVYRNGAHGPYDTQAEANAVFYGARSQSGADSPGPHNVPAGLFAGGRGSSRRARGRRGLTLQQQFARLDLQLAQAQLTATKRDDRRILGLEAENIRERLRTAKLTLAQRTKLTQQLGGILDQIRQLDEKQAKKTTNAAKDAARRRAAAVKAALQQAKQTAHDLIQTQRDLFGGLFQGSVLNPTQDDLKRRLGVRFAPTAPATLLADLKSQIRAYKSFQKDLATLAKRGAPAQLIAELRQAGLDAAPEVHSLATASLGLDRQYFKAFSSRERLLRKYAAQMTTNVNVQVLLDGHEIAAEVKSQIDKTGRRNTHKRRGRH